MDVHSSTVTKAQIGQEITREGVMERTRRFTARLVLGSEPDIVSNDYPVGNIIARSLSEATTLAYGRLSPEDKEAVDLGESAFLEVVADE